jgi:hypothetical protein
MTPRLSPLRRAGLHWKVPYLLGAVVVVLLTGSLVAYVVYVSAALPLWLARPRLFE